MGAGKLKGGFYDTSELLRGGRLVEMVGGDEALLEATRIDSLGLAYGFTTEALGYKINRHEGKVTGLAAYGRPAVYETLGAHFSVNGEGVVSSDFADYGEMRRAVFAIAETVSREDMAASIQRLLEDRVLAAVRALLARHPVSHLALAGGIFANVRLNQRLAEETSVGEVFVYPAMSDQGLAAGGCSTSSWRATASKHGWPAATDSTISISGGTTGRTRRWRRRRG